MKYSFSTGSSAAEFFNSCLTVQLSYLCNCRSVEALQIWDVIFLKFLCSPSYFGVN